MAIGGQWSYDVSHQIWGTHSTHLLARIRIHTTKILISYMFLWISYEFQGYPKGFCRFSHLGWFLTGEESSARRFQASGHACRASQRGTATTGVADPEFWGVWQLGYSPGIWKNIIVDYFKNIYMYTYIQYMSMYTYTYTYTIVYIYIYT
jgi:hypothetical protein